MILGLLPNQYGSANSSSSSITSEKCSILDEVIRRNRILLCGVGLQHNWMVKDEQFTQSSAYQNNVDLWGGKSARLFNNGHWAASEQKALEWVEVDLLMDMIIYGIVTQGCIGCVDSQQYVTSYNIQYQVD